LESFASITNEQFKIRFARSPILRAGRNGFVRNIMIALGNSGSKQAVLILKKALFDSSSLVRIHAEWALDRLSSL
jgi:epoxyqueuosine reductase